MKKERCAGAIVLSPNLARQTCLSTFSEDNSTGKCWWHSPCKMLQVPESLKAWLRDSWDKDRGRQRRRHHGCSDGHVVVRESMYIYRSIARRTTVVVQWIEATAGILPTCVNEAWSYDGNDQCHEMNA